MGGCGGGFDRHECQMRQKVGKKKKQGKVRDFWEKWGNIWGKFRGLVVDFYGTVPVKFIGESGESNLKYRGNVGDTTGLVLVNFSGTDPVKKMKGILFRDL